MIHKKALIVSSVAVVSGIVGYMVGIRVKNSNRLQRGIVDIMQAFASQHNSVGGVRTIEEVNFADVGFKDYGHHKMFHIDKSREISVLITGAGSYIGESFKIYCKKHYPNIHIDTLDMKDVKWREHTFKDENGEPYNCVFHVAGIAHADVGAASPELQEQYYNVNTEIAIECATKARDAGVSQFIFMSSMIIYGGAERIDERTIPNPSNFYGNSKWLADKGVRSLATRNYKVSVLRSPMIYGRGSKGNYPMLSRLAKRVIFFPDVKNTRSMLYIENLCEFVSLLALSGEGGVYFPQNDTYSNTSNLVKMVAEASAHRILISKFLAPVVQVAKVLPLQKVRGLADKAFGSSWYDMKLSKYKGLDYQKIVLEESIRLTEE